MPEKSVSGLLDQYGNSIVKAEVRLDTNFSSMRGNYSGMTTRDIEQKPYKHHAWIFTCVWTIIKNISRLPLVLYNEEDPNEIIRDHEVLDILNRPNPLMTKTPFIQAILLSLLLPSGGSIGFLGSNKQGGGQCFLVCYGSGDINTVDLTRGQIPILILPYPDSFITPKTLTNNGLNNLTGWEFQVPGYPASKKLFGVNEIIRVYQFNPYNWLGGISNYEPAQIAMLQDIKSDVHNINLFAKGNVPVGVLETEQVVGRTKKEEQLRHWNETMGNPNNPSGVAITEKGLKYRNIGLTNLDMQYAEMKKFLQEQFTAVYGLNKIAMGQYEDINHATIVEGRKMLWQDTYLPMAQMIEEPINTQWIKFVDKGLRLKFDTSGIAALRPDYTSRAKSFSVMVDKGFFPPVLAAELTQIPLPDNVLDLYPWLTMNPAELKKMSRQGVEDKLDEKEDKKTVVTDSMTNEGKETFWKNYVNKVLDPLEKKLQTIMTRFFYRQRNLMQDKVDGWLRNQTEKAVDRVINAKTDDFLFDKEKETVKLVQVFEPIVKPQMRIVEINLKEELGQLIEFNVTDEMAVEYSKENRFALRRINNTTFNRAKEKVSDAIETAIKENMTPQQAAKEIKAAINKVYNGEPAKSVKGRIANSKTIARTEIGKITGQTRFKAFSVEGIEYHEWFSALDEIVRKNHRPGDGDHGIVRRIGNVFPHTGLKYPLDLDGRVEEIVNCRCVALAHPGPETT